MVIVSAIVFFVRALLGRRAAIAAENSALRRQLAVLQLSMKRPRLLKRDHVFWVWLSRLWANWRSCLMIVKPETVVRWRRQSFRLDWQSRCAPD